MSQTTSIEWTDHTWNPTHGCGKVSPGCAHCYAEELSLRYRHTLLPWTPANSGENVLLKPHKLREPLSTGKQWQGLGAAAAAAGKTDGMLVFVNSTSDLFHEEIPFEFVDRVFETMAAAERHDFQILTKRPERMLEYFEYVADYMALTLEDLVPWPNVWLGVSIENRRFVGRADILRQVPAAVRFISAEPLLGPLVFDARSTFDRRIREWSDGHPTLPPLSLRGIDWLIAGGESGPEHRPMDLQWVRDLRDECAAAGTVYFVKQLGGSRPGTALDDLPEDLRVREFPRARERNGASTS